ncbi:MAG: hypothetical protein P1P90_01755 [Patescibacteria group bacterium]|nr:hypothetical protein [Patescibacteria group bacterium]
MKIFLRFTLFLLFIVGFGFKAENAYARMPDVYPVWGYNAQDHICQIKQESEQGLVNENLLGDYWNIRECRSNHPEIIFYSGGGILIWFCLLIFVFALHYLIFPKLDKRNKAEKAIFFVQDIIILAIVMFFIVLLQHYFDIPMAVYNYQSDADHIIYSTFIKNRIPLFIAGVYILISSLRLFFAYQKNR